MTAHELAKKLLEGPDEPVVNTAWDDDDIWYNEIQGKTSREIRSYIKDNRKREPAYTILLW